MTTRRAKDKSTINQARYASSTEFERGLVANMVAKRCALVDSPADRELVWFIQYLSHQEGSLSRLAKNIIAKYSDRIQTVEMAAANLRRGKMCDAGLVRKLRPVFGEQNFPLKGESFDDFFDVILSKEKNEFERQEEADRTRRQPTGYLSDEFLNSCVSTANAELEKAIIELCLNPESTFERGPWYFPTLIETLREFKADFVTSKSAGIVVTALGQKVCDTLDYTSYSRGLTLMQGEARTGKSFAARAWCEQRPGLARFIEVPPDNDRTGFFRALARGLGLGNFLNYKAHEIRERVESVILGCDLVLVFDEAQRLWPQRNLRYGFPDRIVWVMTMANAGVPISMISTPQFIHSQKIMEKAGWNSAQLTGRIGHFEALPAALSFDDLEAVAKSALPEVSQDTIQKLATYAQVSARNLAAIDSISKRARYIAMRAGRSDATTEDVRKAMQESVIPADTKLQEALTSGKASKPLTPVVSTISQTETITVRRRGAVAVRRGTDLSDLGTAPSRNNTADFAAPLIGV